MRGCEDNSGAAIIVVCLTSFEENSRALNLFEEPNILSGYLSILKREGSASPRLSTISSGLVTPQRDGQGLILLMAQKYSYDLRGVRYRSRVPAARPFQRSLAYRMSGAFTSARKLVGTSKERGSANVDTCWQSYQNQSVRERLDVYIMFGSEEDDTLERLHCTAAD